MEDKEIYDRLRQLTEKEQYDSALELSKQALEQNPEDDMLWYLRANVYKKQELWKQAIDTYTKAIELNPKNPATTMRRICIDILNFYDKTMYNP